MTLISVPDMTCGHCKASVQAALSALPGVSDVAVDLTLRQVQLTSTNDTAPLLAAVADIGFPARVIAGA